MFDLKRSRRLLILGLLLPAATGCSSLRNAREPMTASSMPEAKISQDKIGVIPTLDAHLTKLVFFSSGPSDIAPVKNPTYRIRFEHAATTRVHPEIQLDYPRPGRKIYFTLTVHVRENGKTFRIVDYDSRIEPDWTSSKHSVGIGVLGTGNWRVGTYEADIHINGDKVATGYFEVY
jgi:hypothetical protein